MSVAAMTMDDQLNSYNNSQKMSKQYEATTNVGSFGHQQNLGPASPEPPQQHHHQQQQQEQQSFSAEQRNFEAEIESLKAEQIRLAQQFADSQRREKILTRRLANKEQEFQDYVSQIAEYKANQAPSALALRSALLDPAVNLLFEKLKRELKATKAKLEETQNELSAWKFTPDSNTGKRLMAKCRLLYQENEELGKMTSSGRLAKLETELAMQKSFSEEVKKSQSELDDFLQELDEDVEGMQSTILFLQQELKTTRERIQVLEKENYQLKNGGVIIDDEININNNKDNENENIESNTNDLIHIQQHTGLNGNILNSNTNSNNNDSSTSILNNYQQQNELKFQTTTTAIKLTPIQEEPCVRVKAYTCGNDDGNSYYNGNTNIDEQQQPPPTPLNHENIAGNRTLRTTASRKRAYESNENETNAIIDNNTATLTPIPATVTATQITTPIQHTIAQVVSPPVPRTLPPKKSKLRMTPPTIQQDPLTELKENENFYATALTTAATAAAVSATINTLTDSSIAIDNAAGTVIATNNEETVVATATTNIEEHAGNGAAPQRIMTRRRSMRAQQNGA